MHLYIALHGIPYHWALVTSDTTPTGIVNIYKITLRDGVWKLEHDRARLTDLAAFLGCVCLTGSTAVAEPTEHIDAFIREFPAEPGRFRTDGGTRWSCARWIMRCLGGLAEAGIVQLDMEGLSHAVGARGAQLEAGKGAISVAGGIPIIDL